MPSGILTPDIGPQFVLPFGYNGNDFYGLRVDTTGVVVPALRTSLPWDRGGTQADISWSGTAGNHGNTVRATYTVPAGYFALITHGCLYISANPASGVTWLNIQVRNNSFMILNLYPTSLIDNQARWSPFAIPLLQGNVVNIVTGNTSVTSLNYVGTCGILRFAK